MSSSSAASKSRRSSPVRMASVTRLETAIIKVLRFLADARPVGSRTMVQRASVGDGGNLKFVADLTFVRVAVNLLSMAPKR